MNEKLANLLGRLCRWRAFDTTGMITQYGVYQVCAHRDMLNRIADVAVAGLNK